MSRSRKKSPVCGVVSQDSEKQEKQDANRALRRRVKQHLGANSDDMSLPVLREVSDVWSISKDGKFRFNPSKDPKLMRK